MTTIEARFLDQLHFSERSAPAPPELLPSRLASVCYEVLPIAAAAISVFTSDGFRFPVGASGPRAAYAERLQFTTGEGPCLDLRSAGSRPILADDRTVHRSWPRFRAALLRHTPFRAVAALPLTTGSRTWATLDLFFCSDDELHRLPVPDAIAVSDVVGELMRSTFGRRSPADGNPVSAARHLTVTAMGLLNTGHGLTAEEALTALRSRAAQLGMTVDALADALVHGRLLFDEVAATAAPSSSRSASCPSTR